MMTKLEEDNTAWHRVTAGLLALLVVVTLILVGGTSVWWLQRENDETQRLVHKIEEFLELRQDEHRFVLDSLKLETRLIRLQLARCREERCKVIDRRLGKTREQLQALREEAPWP